jgi:lactoylglutathione lyase
LVRGLDHVGIHVDNLERSLSFYQTVFGLTPGARLVLGKERIAFLETGGGEGGEGEGGEGGRLELIEDDRPGRPTGVLDHVALRVDSIAQLLDTLRSHNVELIHQAPLEVPAIGARILFCVGPDGEQIELFELASSAESKPADAAASS